MDTKRLSPGRNRGEPKNLEVLFSFVVRGLKLLPHVFNACGEPKVKKERCHMLRDPLFDPYFPMFPMVTDTASPQKPIPLYFIHSVEQPFCRNADCACHERQKEVARLLGLINDGIMTLREAAQLWEGDI
jgi:hypothetical protein